MDTCVNILKGIQIERVIRVPNSILSKVCFTSGDFSFFFFFFLFFFLNSFRERSIAHSCYHGRSVSFEIRPVRG